MIFASGKEKLGLNSDVEVEIVTEDGTEVEEDIFGELPPSTIFTIKDKVVTPENTRNEDIETIQKGILTNSFLLFLLFYNYVLNITKMIVFICLKIMYLSHENFNKLL